MAREHRDEKGHMAHAQSAVARKMRGEAPHHGKHHSEHHGKRHHEHKKETHKEKKMHKVMKEFKEGKLHSGSKHGPEVKSRKQAIAIGMSEGRRAAHGHRKGHGK